MTKREARKAAYRQIVNENKGHQQVFDELRASSGLEVNVLAKIVSEVPSAEKRRQNKTLVTIFIVLCALTIITRILGVVGLSLVGELNTPLLMIVLALGLIVPAVAIYGAVTWRMEMLLGSAGLLGFSLFRTLTKDRFLLEDPVNLVALIPHVLVIVFAIVIPMRAKTKFTEKVVTDEIDGKKVSRKTVVFEKQDQLTDTELLDL